MSIRWRALLSPSPPGEVPFVEASGSFDASSRHDSRDEQKLVAAACRSDEAGRPCVSCSAWLCVVILASTSRFFKHVVKCPVLEQLLPFLGVVPRSGGKLLKESRRFCHSQLFHQKLEPTFNTPARGETDAVIGIKSMRMGVYSGLVETRYRKGVLPRCT